MSPLLKHTYMILTFLFKVVLLISRAGYYKLLLFNDWSSFQLATIEQMV